MGFYRVQGCGFRVSGLEVVEKKMKTTVMAYIGTTNPLPLIINPSTPLIINIPNIL